MAFFRPFLSDPFFAAPSTSLFSPSSSLLFDDDLFSPTPLYLYDAPASRGRAGRRAQAGGRQQQLLKEQQASSQDNAQAMVSGAADSGRAATAARNATSPSSKQVAATNNNNNSNSTAGSSLRQRQPRLLSPLSLLTPFSPAASLLSTHAALPSMSVDVLSTPTEYTVHASVPGVAKQDLTVTVEDGVLTIEAERREETRQGRTPSSTTSNNNNKQQQQQPSASTAAATSPRQPEQKEHEEKTATAEAAATHTSSEAMDTDTTHDATPQYQHVESFYGHVSRSITLPDDCDTAGMAARHEHGVLTISIPRVQDKRQRGTRLEIQ